MKRADGRFQPAGATVCFRIEQHPTRDSGHPESARFPQDLSSSGMLGLIALLFLADDQ